MDRYKYISKRDNRFYTLVTRLIQIKYTNFNIQNQYHELEYQKDIYAKSYKTISILPYTPRTLFYLRHWEFAYFQNLLLLNNDNKLYKMI